MDSNIATVTLAVTSVNDAPQGMSATVTTLEDTDYVFQLADFGFGDAQDAVAPAPDGNIRGQAATGAQSDQTLDSRLTAGQPVLSLSKGRNDGSNNFAAVIIDALPLAGILTNNGVAVVAGQSITAVNDAPVAADTQAATEEDIPLNLNLLAAASDVDGDVLTPTEQVILTAVFILKLFPATKSV